MNNNSEIAAEIFLDSESLDNNLKRLFCQSNNSVQTGYEIITILVLLLGLSSVKILKLIQRHVRRTF